MDIKDALSLTLDQIISKLDSILYLDETNLTQTPAEFAYIRNQFNTDVTTKPEGFTGIFDIERAYSLMHRVILDKGSMINSIENVSTNNIELLEEKERELDNILSLCNNYIMHISSIIDTALYNNCNLLSLKSYNYFGFNKNNYRSLLQSAQYKNTSSVISSKVFYEVFAGKSIIGERYMPTYSMLGVANKVPKDKLLYRLHRLICMLIKIERRELASVICRLLLTQLEIEDRLQKDTKM